MNHLKFVVFTMAVWLMGVTAAWAQTSGEVAVLITEVIEEGLETQPGPRAWWVNGEEPAWTESDTLLFDQLLSQGVAVLRPESIHISRIYRRPLLPLANAAQLGGLLGATRVLVGTITYAPLEPMPPLRRAGIAVTAEVELAGTGGTDGVSMQRFTVSRKVYGEETETLMLEALQEGTRALGDVMGRSLRRARGKIGVETAVPLLALRNLQTAETLERLRGRMLELDEIDSVEIRWASEGVVALEINEEGASSLDLIEYVASVIENHRFENFWVERAPRPVVPGTVELWVESRASGF